MHELVGTQPEISAWLSRWSAAVQYTTLPEQLPDGRFLMRVQLRSKVPARIIPSPTRRRPRAGLIVAAVVVGLLALAGLIFGAWLLWLWAVAHWAQIVAAIAGLILLFAVLGQLGACPGIHCPGCKHR